MRTRKTPDFQRSSDWSEDLFDLFGEDGAETTLVQAFELLLRDGLADAMRRFGPEVRGDQRLLDVV